ncbi:hypothetical protein SRHO_G00022210 [Serrasalmus rhombeus]
MMELHPLAVILCGTVPWWVALSPHSEKGLGTSLPASLIISPSRTQHFITDRLSLSCQGQSESTGWRWCQSDSGGRSSPLNITVLNSDVILENIVHPLTDGDPLTLAVYIAQSPQTSQPISIKMDFSSRPRLQER